MHTPLGHADADADEDDVHQPIVRQDGLQADHVRLLLFLGDELHLTVFGDGPILGTHRLQYRERLVVAALLDQPSRRLRHPQHAEEQRGGGQCANPEHDPPDAIDVTEHGADDRVDHERGELTGDDRQLVAPGDRSSNLVGRHLREVDRDHGRGTPDRQPENDSAAHQDREADRRECAGLGSGWREDDEQDADEEQHREQQDRLATSNGVGELPHDEGTERGGEYERADDDAQL